MNVKYLENAPKLIENYERKYKSFVDIIAFQTVIRCQAITATTLKISITSYQIVKIRSDKSIKIDPLLISLDLISKVSTTHQIAKTIMISL